MEPSWLESADRCLMVEGVISYGTESNYAFKLRLLCFTGFVALSLETMTD